MPTSSMGLACSDPGINRGIVATNGFAGIFFAYAPEAATDDVAAGAPGNAG